MFDWIRSIRFRLALWFGIAVALVVILLGGAVYIAMQQVLIREEDHELLRSAQRAVAPSPNSSDDPMRQLALIRNAPARLVALDGTLLQTDELFPADIALSDAIMTDARSGIARYDTLTLDTLHVRLYSAPVQINGTRVAVVQVAQSIEDILQTLADLRRAFFIALPLSVGLAMLGGLFLANRALAPMEHVRHSVELIEANDLIAPHPLSRHLPNDEIGKLAQTFDRLLERARHAMQREREFTSDASHELRAPLTVMKAAVTSALGKPRTAEAYRATLENVNAMTDELNAIIQDLLTLARSSQRPPQRTRVDLAEIAQQATEPFNMIADKKGVRLEMSADAEPVWVSAESLQLRRAISNLIDNAIRYTPSGGSVTVRAFVNDNRAQVDVQDTGIGIGAQHLPRVFERFYRADSGRGRDSGGTGLGLAIVRAIAQSHGGEVSVTSLERSGSRFSITLPIDG